MKKFSKILVVGFLVSVLISAVVILTTRNDAYYNEYNYSIVVTVAPQVEDKDEVYNQLRTIDNISSVNAQNYQVSVQRSSVEDVQTALNDNEIAEQVVVQEVDQAKDFGFQINYAIIISLLIFGATLVGAYLFNIRFQKRNVYKLFSRTTSLYFDSAIASILVITGLLLLISRVYELRVVDLSIYILSALVGSFIIFSATNKMRFVQFEQVKEVNNAIFQTIQPLFNLKFIMLLIIILPILFSLGTGFVILAILLIASYLITAGAFYSIIWVRSLLDNLNKVKTQTANQSDKTETTHITSTKVARRKTFYNKNIKKKK